MLLTPQLTPTEPKINGPAESRKKVESLGLQWSISQYFMDFDQGAKTEVGAKKRDLVSPDLGESK